MIAYVCVLCVLRTLMDLPEYSLHYVFKNYVIGKMVIFVFLLVLLCFIVAFDLDM